MDLQKLFEMQKVLDDHIMDEHPELKGQNNLDWKVLALQVEVGECANEWRGFKKWSNRQTPKMYPLEMCDYCGENVEYTRPTPFMGDAGASMCKVCWDSTKEEYAASNGEYIPTFEDYPHFTTKKPIKLLEEYVDGLHFVLSVGLELDEHPNLDDRHEYYGSVPSDDLTKLFNDIYYIAATVTENKFHYEQLVFEYIRLGELLGFTWGEIEKAYITKNAVNHKRQEDGY